MRTARDYANEITDRADDVDVQVDHLRVCVQAPAESVQELLGQAGMALAVGRQLIDAGARCLQIAEGLKFLAEQEEE